MRNLIFLLSFAITALPAFADSNTSSGSDRSNAKITLLKPDEAANQTCKSPSQLYQIDLQSGAAKDILIQYSSTPKDGDVLFARPGEVRVKRGTELTIESPIRSEYEDKNEILDRLQESFLQIKADFTVCVSNFSLQIIDGNVHLKAENDDYILDRQIKLNDPEATYRGSVLLSYTENLRKIGEYSDTEQDAILGHIMQNEQQKGFTLEVSKLLVKFQPKSSEFDEFSERMYFKVSFLMDEGVIKK